MKKPLRKRLRLLHRHDFRCIRSVKLWRPLIQALMVDFLSWDVMPMNAFLLWFIPWPFSSSYALFYYHRCWMGGILRVVCWQDMSKQPPNQELVAKDLLGNEWRFRHIFRGSDMNWLFILKVIVYPVAKIHYPSAPQSPSYNSHLFLLNILFSCLISKTKLAFFVFILCDFLVPFC